jgi:endonuclease/exonuclease/phosphatase family metal-dependent hydrolase
MKFLYQCLFVLLAVSCGFGNKAPATKAPPEDTALSLPKPLQTFSATSPSITLMTWNVENLYDAEDDPQKQDETYLPLQIKKQIPNHFKDCKKLNAKSWQKQCVEWDWNDSVVSEKLRRLGQVIRSVNSGAGPDFLALQEVENIQLLQRLIDEQLPNMNYKAYLIENNDARGIDVGVITRLPITEEPRLIPLGKSRPALKLSVELPDKNKLVVTVVHFPIANSPLKKRLSMMSQVTNESSEKLQIILGDFNFPRDEMEENEIAKTYLLPRWVPAHLYCTSCQGSTYETFTGDWSFLDMILVNESFFSSTTAWTVDVDSFRLHNPLPFQTNKYGSPADFTLPSMRGVSDHWPLVIRLFETH